MSWLKIFNDSDPEQHKIFYEKTDIASELADIGVGFERWETKAVQNNSDEGILAIYQEDIARIKEKHNFKSVDLINLNFDRNLTGMAAQKQKTKLEIIRNKFLKEHTHSDDEVRYFIDGQGLFCIHKADKVFQILCCKNDFISVPTNLKHWFDTGEEPNFKCIRFFSEESGWIAEYTGDTIADQFPKLE